MQFPYEFNMRHNWTNPVRFFFLISINFTNRTTKHIQLNFSFISSNNLTATYGYLLTFKNIKMNLIEK